MHEKSLKNRAFYLFYVCNRCITPHPPCTTLACFREWGFFCVSRQLLVVAEFFHPPNRGRYARAHVLITENDIRQYLDRIAESGALGRGARRPSLLEYLLRAEASGEGDKIKAYSIGVDVFDKPDDFDPTLDSSVRVEVGRLRTAIALFEAGEFADTAIELDIPVGTYRPKITRRETVGKAEVDAPSLEQPPQPVESTTPSARFGRASLVLAALTLLLGASVYYYGGISAVTDADLPISLTVEDFGGDSLGKELSILVKDSFANNKIVAITGPDPRKIGDGHFLMRGNVTKFDDFHLVSVELTDTNSSQIVWNHVFELKAGHNLKGEVDSKLNGELETRLLGAAKVRLEDRNLDELTPQQLFILATWVSGPAKSSLEWETGRVDLMKRALALDPDFGPAHSVLADKYGFLANVHPDWDTAENLELSRFHAERAAELAPLDANVMFNVAQSHWHAGRHIESQRVFRRVTELDSGNSLARFFAIVVPYWCDEVPPDIMEWAIKFDESLSRDDPIRWIVLTWISTLHTNRGEYDLALKAATDAARIFQVGYTYMLHAMLLHKAGYTEIARKTVEWQFSNWPGISVDHYATSTIPRLCREQARPTAFLDDYKQLQVAIGDQ